MSKRAFAKGLTITSGLMSMKGDVLNPAKPGLQSKESFKMACPIHPETPHGVKQRYACEEDVEGDTVPPGECLKARETDDGWILVSKEDAQATKESDLPKLQLELHFHPYDPSKTFASGLAYVFVPESSNQFYATLLESVDSAGVVQTDDGPKMVTGLVSLKERSEMFVRLERWGDQLVIRELIRPENLDEFAAIDASADTKMLAMFRQLVAMTAEEFDADVYRKRVQDRIEALVEATKSGEGYVPQAKEQKQQSTEDMMAVLEASIALAKGKTA